MATPSATGLHFLLLPYIDHGHITPMLSLASQLVSLQCNVTFLKPPERYREPPDGREDDGLAARHSGGTLNSFSSGSQLQVTSSTVGESDPHSTGSDLLQFVEIPDPVRTCAGASANVDSTHMSSRHHHFEETMAQHEERQAAVERFVQESKASAHPFTCVVGDLFVWKSAQKIASSQGLYFTILVTSSALAFYTQYLRGSDRGAELEKLLVSGYGLPPASSFGPPPPDGDARPPGHVHEGEGPDMRHHKMKPKPSPLNGIENANADILVNSFTRLEAPLLPALESSGLKVRFIGPCLPSWDDSISSNVGSQMMKQAGSAFMEEEACLPWLDRQEDRSVLFVSFGSQGHLKREQVEEIAMGVEMSRYKFLWVMRLNTPATSGPFEEFRNRHSCRRQGVADDSDEYIDLQRSGMFVGWAPQRKVLQHRAVGGFLTHSGWNSTMESLMYGVPMLCLPLAAEQPLNANLVESHWRVGLRLQGAGGTSCHDQGGSPSRVAMVVDREEVERGVRAIMEGRFTEQVIELQQAAHMAARHDAPNTLASFIEDVRNFIPTV